MSRRIFLKVVVLVAAVLGTLILSGAPAAQGSRDEAFERVKAVQEEHTERLMAIEGVEGTAVGLDRDNRPAVKVFTAGPGVRGIPKTLDGVPVEVTVTGKFYALPKPPSPPGLDKKNPPPNAPTDLTATALSSTEIDLDWADNADENLSHYNVYRSGSSGGPYARIASNVQLSEYSDAGLAHSTAYYYVVTAVDTGAKESDYSGEASATTQPGEPDKTPPAGPTGLTATAVSSSQIDLDWADNTEEDLSHYNVYRSETSAGSYGLIASNVMPSSFSDSALAAETTYYYVVKAVDTSNNESDDSGQASATTGPVPDKPLHWCERPVPIGVSTGHPDITAGTIGCRVTDGVNVYALSNNHVFANENKASIGDNVLQPGPYDGGADPDDAIGTVADFEPIDFHPRATNTMDAAIAVTSEAMLGNATPSGDLDYPDGYGTPASGSTAACVGLDVQKYGRTTGHTYGQVTGINATVKVAYSSRKAIFVNQIIIEPGGFSAGGDSGSLVVTKDGKAAVGLLFAGSSTATIASPIGPVLERFGVTIDGQ